MDAKEPAEGYLMSSYLKKHYFRLRVLLLLLSDSSKFFHKINQLNWYKNLLETWVDDHHLAMNAEVLEAGCATGTLCEYLVNTGYRPTGIDASSKMIEVAKRNSARSKFLVADVLDLPFDAESFDAVIATSLINIVTDKNKAMSELARTCKKGGLVTILVPSADFNDTDLQHLIALHNTTGFSAAVMEAWHKKPPKMKTNEIEDLFKDAGLKAVTTKTYLGGMVVSSSALKPN